jgi:hypothetical protein
MADDMIERAAQHAAASYISAYPVDQAAARFNDMRRDVATSVARAALLAALDPEDEAFIAELATQMMSYVGAEVTPFERASAAVCALRCMAQQSNT